MVAASDPPDPGRTDSQGAGQLRLEKLVLILDVLILALFWLLSLVVIAPSHNLLVVYAETSLDLPRLTDQAIAARFMISAIPLAWAIVTVAYGQWLAGKPEHTRVVGLVAHAMVSVLLGLVMLITYSLAGILAMLKIGQWLP